MYPTHIVCDVIGRELLQAIEEIRDNLPPVPIYAGGIGVAELAAGYLHWDELLQQAFPTTPCKGVRSAVTMQIPACYIYTSGTTGNVRCDWSHII
jgi:acyl-coenzyme A synthetase/AMP-(fatty) acid ligase